jgi:DNA replication protein DnaC
MKGPHVLDHQTIEGLHALKLPAMAAGLAEQAGSASHQALSFDERLGLLVDRELAEREDRRLERYLKAAKLRTNAVIEDVDFRRQRGLERPVVLGLAESAWVTGHHNVAVVGPTGVGKTFLACALANCAVRRGHTALYLRASRMLDELAVARVDGRFGRLTASWARVDVLVIDDFLIRPLTADQAADTLEVIEDRAGLRATVITSQLPIALWHEAMGEPTVADAVVDRVLSNLHRIELQGESMRRPESASTTAGGTKRGGSGAKRATRPAPAHDAGGAGGAG